MSRPEIATSRPDKPGRGQVSRRVLLGAAGAGLLGLGVLEAIPHVPPFLNRSHAGSGRGRVLVAYDSLYSTTGGVADALGAAIASTGPRVDVHHIKDAPSPSGYDAVVVGAPAHTDAWKDEGVEWLAEHHDTLAHVPHALFLTAMSYALDSDRDTQNKIKSELLEKIAQDQRLRPVAVKPFAGAADFDIMGGAVAAAYMAVSRTTTGGDHRHWGAVTGWGLELGRKLGVASTL